MKQNYYPANTKKHYSILKYKMYSFMYVDEIKTEIEYITNIFLWL